MKVWIAKAPSSTGDDVGQPGEPLIRVPGVIRFTVDDAQRTVLHAGLRPKVVMQASTEPRGTVVEQAPRAGELAKRGQSVQLWSSDGSLTVVPDLRGALRRDAEQRLRAYDLTLAGSAERESTAPAGRILGQSPGAGTTVRRGSGVTIVVAKALPFEGSGGGPAGTQVQVPDLSGRDLRAADGLLSGRKLRLGTTGSKVSSAGSPGTVMEQDPAPNTWVRPGSAVNVWIAKAADPSLPRKDKDVVKPQPPPEPLVPVPNVVGLAIAAAQRTLSQAGLQPGRPAMQASTEPEGTVVAQAPGAGAPAKRGQSVHMWASDGSLTVVPDLDGKSRREAEALLRPHDLTLAGSAERESTGPAGRIIEHSPGAGARVRRGSGVNIVLAKAPLVMVPDVVGTSFSAAQDRLVSSRLTVGGPLSVSSEQPTGAVLKQDPPGGTAVPVGTAVHFTVSDGTLARVPELAGLTEAAAADRLREFGLAPGERADEESPRAPGEIVRQALAAGTLVTRGTRVDYTVAALQMRDVPDVTGLPVADAATRLGALGLRLAETTRRHDNAREGTVIAQRPDPSARVQIGTEVAVEVSSGQRFGMLGFFFIVGVGAFLAAVGVAAANAPPSAPGAGGNTIQVTARIATSDVPARSARPLKVDRPVVRIRARLEAGPTRVSPDRLVVRRERGNS